MIIPETERKATLSVLHMGHYVVDRERNSLLARNF